MTELAVRPYRAGDEHEFLALHRRSFGPPLWDLAWFRWRFDGPPGGSAPLLGAFDADGRCRMMYGSVRLGMRFDGERSFGLCMCDAAIDPALRGRMAGHRTMIRMAQTLIHDHLQEGGVVAYGIPEPALRRVTLRHYAQALFDLTFLVRDSSGELHAPEEVRVEPCTLGAEVDGLWEVCARDFRVAVVRDATYLGWRYRDHPRVDYTLLGARAPDGALRGVCVLREGGWHPDVAALAEWLVPRGDLDAERALLSAALRYARERERPYLVTWFSPACEALRRFQTEYGFFMHPTTYQCVARWNRPHVDRDWLHARWYQTMGDIEFF